MTSVQQLFVIEWIESKRQLISYVGKPAHKERQKKTQSDKHKKKEKLIIDRPYIYLYTEAPINHQKER